MKIDHLIQFYADRHSTELDDYAPEAERLGNLYSHDIRMISDKIQGKMLALFSRLINPSLIVEIGTFTGYSTYMLLAGLKDDGTLITIDHNTQYHHLARKVVSNSPKAQQVKCILQPALEVLADMPSPIDLVFMDAAKREYSQYYDILLPKMRSGGLIIADNTLWKGKVVDPTNDTMALALDTFNKKVFSDPRVDTTLLPHRDGLSLIYVK